MKKLFAGLVASIMMAGLVSGLTSSTAFAGSDYPASVPTRTHVNPPDDVKRGDTARFSVNVTKAGDVQGEPRGEVTVKVFRNASGDLVYRDSKDFNGDRIYFRTDELNRRGGYTIKATFHARDGSKWADSFDTGSFNVTRKG